MNDRKGANPSAGLFATTRWSVVALASAKDPEGRRALEALCEMYWTPVFRFLAREGRSEDAARELAQAFFAKFLESEAVDAADPSKGKFRSYLLGALKRFLARTRRDQARQKRGGGVATVSLDELSESGMDVGAIVSAVPDSYFDRQWALSVMENALAAVEAEFASAGDLERFHAVKPWLEGDVETEEATRVAEQLGISNAALRVAVHRLRGRFRDRLRREVSETLGIGEDATEELRYLARALVEE